VSHLENHPPEHRPDVGHETTDANPKVLAYAFVFLSVLLIVTFVGMWGLFVFFDWRAEKTDPGRGKANQWGNVDYRPPEPRLQTSPGADMQQMLQRENQLMQSYGWVNKASGLVRIPVDRAMDIVAQKGLPKLPPLGAPEDTPNPFSTPSMATTPVATGTDSSGVKTPLGGPASQKEPIPPPGRTGGTTQTPSQNRGNRNP